MSEEEQVPAGGREKGCGKRWGGFLKKIIFNKIVFFKLYFLEYFILRRKERKAKQNVLVLHKQYR